MGKYRATGKQIMFHQDDVPPIHIADAGDNEKAHFLATMANADKGVDGGPFNYAEECEKVNSRIFTPENVEWAAFEDLLARYIYIGEKLNLYKKLFFRGKTPPELGLEYPQSNETSTRHWFRDEDADLVHGLLGTVTEASEMAEILVKMLRGEPIDAANVAEECGDLGWYRERLLKWLGVSNHTINVANIEKLHGRFDGAAFNAVRDSVENRDLVTEHSKLQKSLKLGD